jgi:hypothetical protein
MKDRKLEVRDIHWSRGWNWHERDKHLKAYLDRGR